MKTEQDPTESQKVLRGLGVAMIAGVLSVVIYAAHAGGGDFLSIVSVGVLVAGASAFAGGALGFLFGIPRTLQREDTGYQANTNLEQISDWLTKILVGVGLTQIAAIRSGLMSLTAFAAQGLGPQSPGQVFALALLSYSVVVGFLFGFLWTRLYLAGAMKAADQAALGTKVETLAAKVEQVSMKAETTETKLEELKKQSALDAAALNLAYRQLNPSPDLPQVTQNDLDVAIAAASQPIIVQIFNQAWQVRAENWSNIADKPKMERAIPVFRALIRNDPGNNYHMNHGQLGFALKDKAQPELLEAERELTAAIEIRGSWKEHGWLFYEFNRALCRIMSDPAFEGDQASDPDRKKQILEDLRVGVNADDIKRIVRSDPVIQKWVSLNNITQKDLRPA